VVLVDVLIVRMMAQLATRNVVVADHPLHQAAIVAGQRRVDLEAAPIARMMVQLVSVNAVVVVLARLLPRRLVPPPPAMHTVPPKMTLDLAEMSNGMGTVGQ
jgi:hypothetical protein